MPVSPVRLTTGTDSLRPGFDAIRDELDIEIAFPTGAQAEAEAAAVAGPHTEAGVDLRDIPFVTLDPPGSLDLDQALAIEPAPGGDGFIVHYAIADVGAFVKPGGALDDAARRRGVTVYLPDARAPLHPPVLSEGAASLLPGQERQALVWTFTLDDAGEPTSTTLRRARVRSRRRYTYEEAQAALDAGNADECIQLLREVGLRREALEVARGGVSLRVPEQVVVEAAGRYELVYRAPLAVEGWNAQLSLMTGMAAAGLMLDAGVGVVRKLPAPSPDTVDALRRRARALDVPWPRGAPYAHVIRSLEPAVPDHAAFLAQATRLFRGAGYASFDEPDLPRPADPAHAAVAAPYAHVTAPLRRLVDRFANEIVLAVTTGREPPAWAREALAELPELMQAARQREGSADARAADLVEAVVLSGRVGDVLDAVVVGTGERGAQVQVRRPAVLARLSPSASHALSAGDVVRVRVVSADPAARRVELAVHAER
ncbi:MAG TPA: RNB domain-containing ribonuclease [Acidimicrobiales bacterium]